MQEKNLIEGIAWAFTWWEFGWKGGWKSQDRTGKIYRLKEINGSRQLWIGLNNKSWEIGEWGKSFIEKEFEKQVIDKEYEKLSCWEVGEINCRIETEWWN